MDHNRLKEAINNFEEKTILVIGDVMIDAYITGKVDRISPEAPVPVVTVKNRYNRLGGAANVALNIKTLGANPILCSVIGDDARGDDFLQLLNDLKMNPQGIIRSRNRPTTTKFRIIGNNTQMLRVDEESIEKLSAEEQINLSVKIIDILDQTQIDAIIVEDYDKGCLDSYIIELIATEAKRRKIPVTADPKRNNFAFYQHITLFKPNFKELQEGLNVELISNKFEQIAQTAQNYLREKKLKMMLVTLSENGMLICNKKEWHHIPAEIRNIADVSGAGDTVISTITLGLTLGLSMEEAAYLANIAGGLVCEKVGVVPITKDELLNELS
ncbi:MAG: hypothetical protein JXR34_04225 [Bacteroidales bacterium]|nr:hypothetical protein [Bacteroidales bacterium]